MYWYFPTNVSFNLAMECILDLMICLQHCIKLLIWRSNTYSKFELIKYFSSQFQLTLSSRIEKLFNFYCLVFFLVLQCFVGFVKKIACDIDHLVNTQFIFSYEHLSSEIIWVGAVNGTTVWWIHWKISISAVQRLSSSSVSLNW